MSSHDEERIRLRDALLRTADEDLYNVVTECAKRGVPMRSIAVLIEGDATTLEQTRAGTRSEIAEAPLPEGARRGTTAARGA